MRPDDGSSTNANAARPDADGASEPTPIEAFALDLIVPQTLPPVPATPTACEHCCHWALPCDFTAQRIPPSGGEPAFMVPLTYEAWLVYHWHTRTHQQLDRLPVLAA